MNRGQYRTRSAILLTAPLMSPLPSLLMPPSDVSSQDIKPYGIAFSNDGTKMFVVGDDHNNINQYTLSIAFDISTAFYDGNDERFSALQDTSPRGMAFSNDGTKMFVVGDRYKNINQYALSPPFDVSTAIFVTPPFDVSTQSTSPKGMAFSNDGTKMFVVSSIENAINQYALSPPLMSPLPSLSRLPLMSRHRILFQKTWHSQMTAPRCL